jgi:hypothetical protein
MASYEFEGNPILAPLTFLSNDRVISSETANLKQLVHRTNAQRWDLQFTILTNKNAGEVLLGMLDNTYTVKTMIMPQITDVENASTTTGQITTSQTVSAGATSVVCGGGSGTLSKGSFIQFSNHSKIYITTTDWDGTSDSIDVFPSLRNSVPVTTTVYFGSYTTKPQLNYLRSTSNISGITYSDGVLASPGSINLQEVV